MKTFFSKGYVMPTQKYRGSVHDVRFPCFASLKKDGELDFLLVKNGNAICVNKPRYGRVRQDFPITIQAKNLPDGLYIGELYWNEGRTKEDFHEFLAHKCDDLLKMDLWAVLVCQNEVKIDTERNYAILEEIRYKMGNGLSIIPYWKINNTNELTALKNRILAEGWEGLVIRNLNVYYEDGQSINWIKIKRKGRDLEMKAQEEVTGLMNLYERLAYLIGRKVTRDEQHKLSVLKGDDCYIIDDFKVGMKAGSFCCYLIAKVK